MIKAVIYDMDGIIINTVPLGKSIEGELFKKHGKEVSGDIHKDTVGMREDEALAYWCSKYGWHDIDQAQFLEDYYTWYINEVKTAGVLLPGVKESLEFFSRKNLALALASSSTSIQIDAVLNAFDLRDSFIITHSAEYEPHGKPHPSVYLSTAKRLEIDPACCVAIEDSINGLISAKAAKMKCIAIPLPENNKNDYCLADFVLNSLKDINDDIWREINQ